MAQAMDPSRQFPRPSYNQLEEMYYQLLTEKEEIANRLATVEEQLQKVRRVNVTQGVAFPVCHRISRPNTGDSSDFCTALRLVWRMNALAKREGAR